MNLSRIFLEKSDDRPLAVIYHGGAVAQELASLLEKQKLRVLVLAQTASSVPILEHPIYIFFFGGKGSGASVLELSAQFDDCLVTAKKNQSRLVVILDDLEAAEQEILLRSHNLEKCVIVEIRGNIFSGKEAKIAAGKIARFAFTSQISARQTIVGQSPDRRQGFSNGRKNLSSQEVFDQLRLVKRRPRVSVSLAVFGAVFLILFGSVLFCLVSVVGPAVYGMTAIFQASKSLEKHDWKNAQEFGRWAQEDFVTSQSAVRRLAPFFQICRLEVPMEVGFGFLSVGNVVAESVVRGAILGPNLIRLSSLVFSDETGSTADLVTDIRRDLTPLNQNLGLLEAELKSLPIPKISMLIGRFWPKALRIGDSIDQISNLRRAMTDVDGLLSVWGELAPEQSKKTYLVVFQNSAELRPTGGFIGSYALVVFDQGKMVDWQIYDIYSADGQLRGQVLPPDEILHFLGQSSWFMRDANWSPDWPLTARRLAWFLEKETGQRVDGVVGVSLGAVSKILEATGAIDMADFGGQTISAGDFFEKAEYTSEVNFFAGSTAKKDFLGSAAKTIMQSVATGKITNFPKIGLALDRALAEKDLIIYLISKDAQKVIETNGWSGTIDDPDCQNRQNCLMIVEANLGANKSNHFVRREVAISNILDRNGATETTVKISWHNDSNTETWPAGKYKNYLRFLIPVGSKLVQLDLFDGKTPFLSPILTAQQLALVDKTQFFLYQSSELTEKRVTASESAFVSYGTLVNVPIRSTMNLTLRYRAPTPISVTSKNTKFFFKLIKQPGVEPGPLDFSLEFPSFLHSVAQAGALVIPQKVIYNTDTSIDRKFEVTLEK